MYYLGVDLGGTKIAVGIVTENGKLLYKDSVPTIRERGYKAVLKDLATLCVKVIKDYHIDISEIHSIGIGSPGKSDNDKGVIIYANNINFNNTPIREEIHKYIELPVYIDNDANCAALGESVCGAAKGYKDSITITLGTGVGGGIVMNGKIFNGSFYGGGEVGHHVIMVNGEQCTCGRKGCWEAYASATALIRETKLAAAKNKNSEISNIVNKDFRLINAKTAFQAAKKNDKTAQEVIHNYLRYIAEGIANLINIFEPEIIAIGGGVCAEGDNILIPIIENVEPLIYGRKAKTLIKIAELGNDAGIIGAAMLYRGSATVNHL